VLRSKFYAFNQFFAAINMTPVRNIHKKLVAVLFTTGLGLLLMGAQTGHRVFVSAAGWGMNSGVGETDGLGTGADGDVALSGEVGENGDVALSGGIGVNGALAGDSELVQIGKKNLVETAHMPQIHNEGSPLPVHKRPLNRHRNRFGLDSFCAASFITIDHPHFENKGLPDVGRPGVYATILAGSSLRGPPSD
jgi:hypothetical protein